MIIKDDNLSKVTGGTGIAPLIDGDDDNAPGIKRNTQQGQNQDYTLNGNPGWEGEIPEPTRPGIYDIV